MVVAGFFPFLMHFCSFLKGELCVLIQPVVVNFQLWASLMLDDLV